MQRTEPTGACGDSLAMQIDPSCWSALCSTCWQALFLVFCNKSSPSEPNWPRASPYTAQRVRKGFAHRWIAQNGDLPGADFPSEQRTRQQVVIPGSAALLPSGRVGMDDFQLCSRPLLATSPPPFHPTLSLRHFITSWRGRYINHSGCTRRPHSGTVTGSKAGGKHR